MSIDLVHDLAAGLGGRIEGIGLLPDGSGFAVMSTPLPGDHWLTAESVGPQGYDVPPAFLCVGVGQEVGATMKREEWAARLREAGKYALRAATRDGKEMDLDPDALLNNLIVAVLGYWTPDGISHIDD